MLIKKPDSCNMKNLLNRLHRNIEYSENKINNFSKNKFDFYSATSKGKILFVGEGNMSFALNIIKHSSNFHNIIVTTFEKSENLSQFAKINSMILKKHNVTIVHGVDCTNLDNFRNRIFDKIIFGFPNTGTREFISGYHPNYLLVKNFLDIAAKKISTFGSVVISYVDNEYYNNVFKFYKIARLAGFNKIIKYIFDPKDFRGYKHPMTHEEESALEGHKKFATLEFRL